MPDNNITQTSKSAMQIDHKALRQRFNPDGSPLRDMQIRLLEMLKVIDGICRRNDIPYWLSSGTCLGAVRHKGFIPWDDDVDIEMLASDFPRFRKAFESEVKGKYALQTHDTDPYFLLSFAKMRDLESLIAEKGADVRYKYKGLFIDIFILEPSSSKQFSILGEKMVNTLVFRLPKIYGGFIPDSWLAKGSWFIMRGGYLFSRLISHIIPSHNLRHRFPSIFLAPRKSEEIFPLKEAEFEGCKFMIPGRPHEYLERMYRNHMTLPDVSNIDIHITQFSLFPNKENPSKK